MFNLFNNEDGALEKSATPTPRPTSTDSWRVSPGQGGMRQPTPPSEETQKALSLVKENINSSSNWADLQIGRDLMAQAFKDPMGIQGALSDEFTGAEIKAPATDQPTADIPALPMDDPAGTIGGLNSNMLKGVGDFMGRVTPPTPPSPKQATVEMMDAEGKQTMFDMNKIPKWQESDAFYGGLLSMGLNLLSGNDLATSFNAAGQYFDNAYGKEKRQAWAQDLVNQGYDAQDIQRWIETGDNKDLTDPMEKKMRMQQFNLGQQNLNKAIYENSPEMRQFNLDQIRFDNEMKIAKMQQDAAQHAQSIAARMASGNGSGLSARDYSQMQTSIRDATKVTSQQTVFSRNAMRDIEQIKEYKAIYLDPNSTPEQKAKAKSGLNGSFNSYRTNQARSMVGGGAKLTPKDLEATTGLPNIIDNNLNKISMKTNGYPTDEWINSMLTSTRNDVYNQTNTMKDIYRSAYASYAPVLGHDAAQAVIGRIAGSSGIGNVQIDPVSGDYINNTVVDRVGPQTVSISR